MIPDYKTIMLPLMEFFVDNKEHSGRELVEYISNKFSLSEEEKTRTYEVSGIKVINSKTNFAILYLSQAQLLERVGIGQFKITGRGLDVLKNKPDKIDANFLKQFPEFIEFLNKGKKANKEIDGETSQPMDQEEIDSPPIELLERGYKRIKDDLAQELLKQVRQKKDSSEFLEKLVVELLLKMGYGSSREDAGKAVGKTGDGGIDGIIEEDALGLDKIYIQAKNHENPIGSQSIQQFIGALTNNNANKGVFITTSRFTDNAQSATQGPCRIILIDGKRLAQLMINYNLGVSGKTTYEVKEIDTDYFLEQ